MAQDTTTERIIMNVQIQTKKFPNSACKNPVEEHMWPISDISICVAKDIYRYFLDNETCGLTMSV